MDFLSLCFTFGLVWWVVFFIALPIGIEVEKNKNPGHADSAPKNTHLVKKVFMTSIITLIITIIIGYMSHQERIVNKLYEFLLNNI
jgi:predicted secreted protein